MRQNFWMDYLLSITLLTNLMTLDFFNKIL